MLKKTVFFHFLNMTNMTYINKNLHAVKFILIKNHIQKIVESLYRNYNRALFFNNMLDFTIQISYNNIDYYAILILFAHNKRFVY